jgi:hypothetical protein
MSYKLTSENIEMNVESIKTNVRKINFGFLNWIDLAQYRASVLGVGHSSLISEC